MTLGTPAHSATALSNGSRPYDDLESEDDLDREDITFPSDAGWRDSIKFSLLHTILFECYCYTRACKFERLNIYLFRISMVDY